MYKLTGVWKEVVTLGHSWEKKEHITSPLLVFHKYGIFIWVKRIRF